MRHLELPQSTKVTEHLKKIIGKVEELTLFLHLDIDLNNYKNLRKIIFCCWHKYDDIYAISHI